MRLSRSIPCMMVALTGTFATLSCKEKEPAAASVPQEAPKPPQPGNQETRDLIRFRSETRQLYNNRNFAELEAVAKRLREGKERFANGGWKTMEFYECMDPRDDEPENMWQLHDQIHKDWIAKYPESITARVAHAQFMIAYAWYARGSGYAETVSEKGWELHRERLASARTILDESKSLKPGCPVWWHRMQKVALGQGWEWGEANALFKEGKAFEPEYFGYDVARAYYLLPRWHGEQDDWEAAADDQADKQGDLGMEICARVVAAQSQFYDNIFQESKASWRKTKKGFEVLRVRYPDSKQLLNTYCRLACFAGDTEKAKALFIEIGEDNKTDSVWARGQFEKAKAWANSGK